MLSVVLITRNQAWNVDRLVTSVLREAPEAETVLVDSLSTDGTVERAKKHPIRILRLREGWPLAPPAGRYVGIHATSGDAVLFLDGDMELCRGWLERALKVLDADPTVAAVGGRIIDVSPGEDVTIEAGGENMLPVEVEHTRGAGLYRRSVLDEVGPFNPYLRSEDEPELCLRIRDAGYRIVRIEKPVALHLAPAAETLASVWARRGRKLYQGQGQVVRYHFGRRLLWTFLRERRYAWEPALVLAAGAACAGASFSQRRWLWIGVWAGLVVTALGADAVRKRSPRRAAVTAVKRLLILEGALRGLALEAKDPRRYPVDAEVVK